MPVSAATVFDFGCCIPYFSSDRRWLRCCADGAPAAEPSQGRVALGSMEWRGHGAQCCNPRDLSVRRALLRHQQSESLLMSNATRKRSLIERYNI